jgi:AcrR family transcriptional regulator
MRKTKTEAREDAPGTAKAASRGGTLGSKRRPPDDARRSILAAAERLFYAEGIASVGVDAVADAAGVTKRTLYYHFAGKEELAAAYLEARDEATLNALRHAAGDNARPGDRILAVFDFIERWASTAEYRGCPFNNAVAEQSASPKVTAIARRHKATMKSWFTEQAQAGGAESPDELGAELLVLLDGALNGAAIFASPEAAVVARTMAETLLDSRGIERSPRAKPKPKLKRK